MPEKIQAYLFKPEVKKTTAEAFTQALMKKDLKAFEEQLKETVLTLDEYLALKKLVNFFPQSEKLTSLINQRIGQIYTSRRAIGIIS